LTKDLGNENRDAIEKIDWKISQKVIDGELEACLKILGSVDQRVVLD
jgi:hypothetical protein